jgi:RHS repeat-associated protein
MTISYDGPTRQTITLGSAISITSTGDSLRYSQPAVQSALGLSIGRDLWSRVVRRGRPDNSRRRFTYDNRARLSMAIDSSFNYEARRETYTYDAVGNRTDGAATIETGNRLRSQSGYALDYDADGNLVRRTGNGVDQTFTWNSLGQLTQVVSATTGTTTYGYDAGGRRVRKTVNGVTTHYLWDGAHIAAELDAAGNVVAEYTWYPGTDEPYSVRRGGQRYYYLTDGPGNVTGLVDTSGNLVNEYRYGPWGTTEYVRETIPQPFRFTARELDAETGLYYFRARYYDPAVGRFISEDPAGLAGGLNLYVYADNDPVNGRDPFGLKPCNNGDHVIRDQLAAQPNTRPADCLLDPISNASFSNRPTAKDLIDFFGMQKDCRLSVLCHDPATEIAYMQALDDAIEQQAQIEAQAAQAERDRQAVQSSAYYSPGLADIVMPALAAKSRAIYPVLTTYSVVGLTLPLGVIAADVAGGGLAVRGLGLQLGEGSAAEEAGFAYRGVHAGHPALDLAKQGIVVPGDVSATITPTMHNMAEVGSAFSQYTSWTTDLEVARFFAGGPGGVIMRFPLAPAAGAGWAWVASPDFYGESEILLWGIRSGATVFPW